MKKIYLVDGYSFVFRAYHSMPPLTNPEGVPVGAVYGFLNMLLKLVREQQPDYMAVIYDAGKDTFRNEIYPEYKANRPPAPEDLVPQFPLVRKAAEAMKLPVFDKVGVEADDIIATFATRAKAEGLEAVIVSSDKDLMQLIGDGVIMFDAMRSKEVGLEQVKEKFGVYPEKLLDVFALIGDSSDNVPGVPGIGPKTAAELIGEYNSLDELLERAGEIKQPKRRESLLANTEQAKLSRRLIRLKDDVELPMEFDELALNKDFAESLGAFCVEHGFKSIAAKMGTPTPAPAATKNVEFAQTTITKPKELEAWLAGIVEEGKIAIHHAEQLTIARAGKECVIEAEQQNQGDMFSQGNGIDEFIEVLHKQIDGDEVLKTYHNTKDSTLMRLEPFDDVQLMGYVAETGLSDGIIKEVTAAKIYEKHTELKQILFDKRLLNMYERIEKPLITVLKKMEERGAKLDVALLSDLSAEFGVELARLEKKIHALANSEFNIASPQQLGEVLFEQLGLPHGKKSKKTGAYSTGVQVLEDLAAAGHDIATQVLEWRKLAKLISTYTESLQKQVNPTTGRVHTKYMMTSTATGRLSSTEPNLQNIPIRTEEGRKIRAAFTTEAGNKLISADYSQIELRLLAHVADIPPLTEAFKQGKDIHAVTAHQVFGVPLDGVDAEHRRRAKTINFGIIYGLSAHGLAQRLGIGRVEAKEFIDKYFAQYPGIREYMDSTIAECRANGYVETIMGRKCYIRGINDKNHAIRSFSERAAINAPLQGSAADIIKLAMLHLDKANLPMTLQVHDELLFEVPEAEAEQAAKKITRVMESAAQLKVPLIAEANIGDNWGEVH